MFIPPSLYYLDQIYILFYYYPGDRENQTVSAFCAHFSESGDYLQFEILIPIEIWACMLRHAGENGRNHLKYFNKVVKDDNLHGEYIILNETGEDIYLYNIDIQFFPYSFYGHDQVISDTIDFRSPENIYVLREFNKRSGKEHKEYIKQQIASYRYYLKLQERNRFTETEMREETGLTNNLALHTARDPYEDWEDRRRSRKEMKNRTDNLNPTLYL